MFANSVPQSEPGAVKASSLDPESFVKFRETISQPVVAAFCAGGVAGAVSRTVVSPLERLKILMQIQSAGRDAYKLSVGQALGKMWKEEGWRGFMRGNGTNCIRIVPYSAVQFSSYNFYKRVRSLLHRSTRTADTRDRTFSSHIPARIYPHYCDLSAEALQASRPSSSHTLLISCALGYRSSLQASLSLATSRKSCQACGGRWSKCTRQKEVSMPSTVESSPRLLVWLLM